MALTKAQRARIKPSNFGLPGTDEYPIDTPERARDALSRIATNGTPQQQHALQQRVAAKYPGMKVNGTGGNTGKPTGSGAGLPTGQGSKSAAKKAAPVKKAAAKTTAKRTAAKPMRRGK